MVQNNAEDVKMLLKQVDSINDMIHNELIEVAGRLAFSATVFRCIKQIKKLYTKLDT